MERLAPGQGGNPIGGQLRMSRLSNQGTLLDLAAIEKELLAQTS